VGLGVVVPTVVDGASPPEQLARASSATATTVALIGRITSVMVRALDSVSWRFGRVVVVV
jgi:hypothetical protein